MFNWMPLDLLVYPLVLLMNSQFKIALVMLATFVKGWTLRLGRVVEGNRRLV